MSYKCEDCGTEYENWLGKALCRVCFQRSREMRFEVKIPWTLKTQDQLEALHRCAGNIFTVANAEDAIKQVIAERFGMDVENVKVKCDANPRWNTVKGS